MICAEAMRLATRNLGSLALPTKAKISLDERVEVLRRVLERLDDVAAEFSVEEMTRPKPTSRLA